MADDTIIVAVPLQMVLLQMCYHLDPLAIAGDWEDAMKNQYPVALAIANASNLNEDEEILTHEVSDEAVEAAALVKERVGNFTVSYCTVFSNCPA